MYNKLFTKILDSSIWLEATETRIVWITLLAAMDEDGYAHFSAMENLASRARVTIEQAGKAVACLLAPDPNSGNPDHEGRRIERVPGGFIILNAEKHRGILNRVIAREQTRIRVERHRNNDKSGNGHTPKPSEQRLPAPERISMERQLKDARAEIKAIRDSFPLEKDDPRRTRLTELKAVETKLKDQLDLVRFPLPS